MPYIKLQGLEPFPFGAVDDVAYVLANKFFGGLMNGLDGMRRFKELPVECHEPLCVFQYQEGVPARKIPETLVSLRDQLNEYRPTKYPPSVYFLILNGEIVYVGQTTNLKARIRAHRSEGKVFGRVLYLPTPKARLDQVEARFIRELRPPCNKRDGNGEVHEEGRFEFIDPPGNEACSTGLEFLSVGC